MTQQGPQLPQPESAASAVKEKKILGLSTDGLAGLSVDELKGNKTAITMLMHYYSALLEENTSLKNDLNTARTYVEGYERQKTNTIIGSGLLLLSNILIGFGVNLLTSQAEKLAPGYVLFGAGLLLALVGTWFSFKDR